MKLKEFKSVLEGKSTIAFELPDQSLVPNHFHVTEIGAIHKKFIDCGGVVRTENVVNFQLWEANDYDHRLHPEKLLKIIELSEKTLDLQNLDIEVEYQGETIGKYGLDYQGGNFLLTTKKTDCLAKDNCGIPLEKPRVKLSDLNKQENNCCSPSSGCC